jgi:hypothetical protein
VFHWLLCGASFYIAFSAFGIQVGFAGALLIQSLLAFGIAGAVHAGVFRHLRAGGGGGPGLFGVPTAVGVAYGITYHVTTFAPITCSASGRSPDRAERAGGHEGSSHDRVAFRPGPRQGQPVPPDPFPRGRWLSRHRDTLLPDFHLRYARCPATDARGVVLEVQGAETGPAERESCRPRARAVLDATGHRFGVHLDLTKRIPVGAGLGGGSADAAAALSLVNQLAGNPIPHAELLHFAARLGADVPFCLSGAPLALAWSHGERMLALPALPAAPCSCSRHRSR